MTDIPRTKLQELLAGAKRERDQHLYNFHAASGVVQVLEMLLAPPPAVEKTKRVRKEKPRAPSKVKVARTRRTHSGTNGAGESTEHPAVG